MNIFFLDKDPEIAVSALTNQHVVKMVLETGQLLSTAHRVLDGVHTIGTNRVGHKKQIWFFRDEEKEKLIYKPTHFNHPIAKWVRKSKQNYMWTYNYFTAIAKEFELRFNKKHKTYEKLKDILKEPPKNIDNIGFTPIVPAVPSKYIGKNVIETYRAYYEGEKLLTDYDIDRYNFYIEKKEG